MSRTAFKSPSAKSQHTLLHFPFSFFFFFFGSRFPSSPLLLPSLSVLFSVRLSFSSVMTCFSFQSPCFHSSGTSVFSLVSSLLFLFTAFLTIWTLSLPSLSIELQVQEQPPEVRSEIYSHMEAFVPCNKEALLKRLKKLSLNIQVS